MVRTVVRQAVPSEKSKVGQIPTCGTWKTNPMPEQVDVTRGGCDHVGIPCQSVAGHADPLNKEPVLEQVGWQDLWPCGGSMLEEICSRRTAPCGRDPC